MPGEHDRPVRGERDAGPWSARVTGDGSATLFQGELGQACHSDAGAWTEAREVYARATGLRERARSGELTPCRLLDVGTGVGWNLAAALEALEGSACALDVVTLESDPRVVERSVELAAGPAGAAYPQWRCIGEALGGALSDPARSAPLPGPGGRLRLLLGDGRETLPALLAGDGEGAGPFDAVFLDPFSPDVAPALWEHGFLELIARHMAPGSILATYSAASRVRLGLSLAGLRVGRGPGIGNKSEATLASPDRQLEPLPARAAANLARALARHAADRGARGRR